MTLERLGVDVIEAGFAASSPGDFAGVAAVAGAVDRATVASLARTTAADIDAAAAALAGGSRRRIHVFIATSALHMERKLALTPDEVLERVRWSVAYAAELADEVEFSARGRNTLGSRLPRGGVPRGGRRRARRSSTCPTPSGTRRPASTPGCSRSWSSDVPSSRASSSRSTATTTSGSPSRTRWPAWRRAQRRSSAPSTASASARATPSLEEIAMAMRVRADAFEAETGIDPAVIRDASALVCELTGYPVSRTSRSSAPMRSRTRRDPPGRDAQGRRRPTRSSTRASSARR